MVKQRLTATVFLYLEKAFSTVWLDISTSYTNFLNIPDKNQILVSSLMDVLNIL